MRMKYRIKIKTYRNISHDDIFKWSLFWKFHWKLFEANDRIIGKMVDNILGYNRCGKL